MVNVSAVSAVGYRFFWDFYSEDGWISFWNYGPDAIPRAYCAAASTASTAVCHGSGDGVSSEKVEFGAWAVTTDTYAWLTLNAIASPTLLEATYKVQSSAHATATGNAISYGGGSYYGYATGSLDLSSSDSMQILAPGDDGWLRFTWGVDYNDDWDLSVLANIAGTTRSLTDLRPGDTLQATFPVPFGRPFNVSTKMIGDYAADFGWLMSYRYSGASLTLTELDVLSSDLTVISDVRYRSSYPITNGHSVPEPDGLVLLVAMLGCVAVICVGREVLARRQIIGSIARQYMD